MQEIIILLRFVTTVACHRKRAMIIASLSLTNAFTYVGTNLQIALLSKQLVELFLPIPKGFL